MKRKIENVQQWVKDVFPEPLKKPESSTTLYVHNMPQLKDDIAFLLSQYLTHHQNTLSSYFRFTKSKTNPAFGTSESEGAKEAAFTELKRLAESFSKTPNPTTHAELQKYCQKIQTQTALGELQRTADNMLKRIQSANKPELNKDKQIINEANAVIKNNPKLTQLLSLQSEINDIHDKLNPIDEETGVRGGLSQTVTIVEYMGPFTEDKEITLSLIEDYDGEFKLKVPKGVHFDEDTHDAYFAELFDAHTKLSEQLKQKTAERDTLSKNFGVDPKYVELAAAASHPLVKLHYLLSEEDLQKTVVEIKEKLSPRSLKSELQALREANDALTPSPSPTSGRGGH